MAHGANRVTNLVGDARAQTAERRKFGLLHTLVDQACIFEKDEHRSLAPGVATEGGEVSRDGDLAMPGRHGKFRARGPGFTGTPATHEVGKRPINGLEGQSPDVVLRAQELRSRGVAQSHLVAFVDDDNALAQVLDDVLVEFGEIAQIHAPLASKRLACLYAPAQRAGYNGYGEDDGAEYAGGRIIDFKGQAAQLRVKLFAQDCKCGKGGQHGWQLGR